ncbi:MAG: Rpn family recombination-promoting nuclease/putative transposase, partial [Chitinispirillales bacterium]|nr:Rpn family recombination-promoting nuclease/putative transposase [Chitinispirillales bacterium]
MKKGTRVGVKVMGRSQPKSRSGPRAKSRLPEVLPPRYDIIFKQVFANRPDLLKPLLKSMIGLPDGDYGRVVVVDPHIYPEYKGEKLGVLDIKVVLRSKKVIDVEM